MFLFHFRQHLLSISTKYLFIVKSRKEEELRAAQHSKAKQRKSQRDRLMKETKSPDCFL